MKKILCSLFMLIITLSIIITPSCNKEEDDDDNNNNNNTNVPTTPTPSFGDANGVLAAVRFNTAQSVPGMGTIFVEVDAASGAFFNGSNYHDAGEVKVNNKPLTKYQNNTYALVGTSSGELEYATGDPVNWSVSGSANVPSFTHTTTNLMVASAPLSASTPDNIDIDADVILSLENFPTHATDVLWIIIDKDGKIIQKTNSSASVTFTASELATLSKGANAMIQVAAYNYSSQTYGGKKIYFVNETATSKSVTLD